MSAVLNVVCLVAFVYQLAIFAAIVLSWFPVQPGSALETVRRVLFGVTEPVLGPLRRALPPVRLGGFALDLSPIIVLIGLQVLQALVC